MFDERFEAWVHGPVCPDLFHDYKDCGWQPIPAVEGCDDGDLFSDDQLETLEAVWNAYGPFDAKYLEELTHQELPWINARKGYEPGDICSVEITAKDMKEYYSSLI